MSAGYTCRDDGSPCACTEPVPARTFQQEPINVTWQASESGDKWICRCGQSKAYPLCDGSHNAYNAANRTTIQPTRVQKSEDGVWICACGHSDNRPFCSGKHSHLRRIEDETADVPDKQPYANFLWTATVAVLIGAFAYTRFFRK